MITIYNILYYFVIFGTLIILLNKLFGFNELLRLTHWL